ncbi:MAG: indolepyruvate ferredoxin oxidoreductase [Deltaproteobacteria bacterium]|nr:indolepyruvate ferredoxin oxidoreductase [Deltaproteobacteria bacterium]
MTAQLLLGAEAVGQGAMDAGISGAYAYPGTPATEITEFIQNSKQAQMMGIRAAWSTNEKTAYEAALGMSFAGKRSIVSMKHVGLNVAADAFINSAITGVRGGLVITVADDPSMHSSQNEQDSRAYAKFAMVPALEPANQQELYDAMFHAFELSENLRLPVMVRITTRLSHSRSGVVRRAPVSQNPLNPETDPNRFVLVPMNARVQYASLLEKQPSLVALSTVSPMNALSYATDNRSLGIIACGIGYNYVMETLQSQSLNISVCKVGQYPLSMSVVDPFIAQHDSILVVEEGYPIYEELLGGLQNTGKIRGRLTGTLPRMGELNPNTVKQAICGVTESKSPIEDPPMTALMPVPTRPPQLCTGCSHIDLFNALNAVLCNVEERHVFSDIGCYALGALPPFNSLQTCVDMGASVTMAKGAADAGLRPAVCVIGDSTFTHSGMTGLLDAVNDQTSMTVIISDNFTIAMTGGQPSAATNRLRDICLGLGVSSEHLRIIVPLARNHDENVAVLKEEFAYEGVSVIIAQRECIQAAKRNKKLLQKK